MREVVRPDCVDVHTDYNRRVIEITVRLAFYKREGPDRHFAALDPWFVDYMVKNMQAFWSDLKFNCFSVVVKVEAVSVVPPPLTSQKVLCVEIESGREASQVAFDPDKPKDDYLSDDPEARRVPVQPYEPTDAERKRGIEGRAVWTENGASGIWAHELGHVMGLPDGYMHADLVARRPRMRVRPGITRDLMTDTALPLASQTITRLVRRLAKDRSNAEKVDESRITCPLHFRARGGSLWMFFTAFEDIRIDAMAPDYSPPSDDPHYQHAVEFTGSISLRMGYMMGDYNADFRKLLGLLGGVDTAPLAEMHPIVTPIEFTLKPLKPSAKVDKFPVMRLPSEKFTIEVSKKIKIEGTYFWDATRGFPVLYGPMGVNGMNTSGFFPGPPLTGEFYFEDEGGTK